MKLRNKFILWLAPALLLPFMGYLLLTLLNGARSDDTTIHWLMQNERHKVEQFFNDQIDATVADLTLLGSDQTMQQFLKTATMSDNQLPLRRDIQEQFQRILTRKPQYEHLSFFAKDLNLIRQPQQNSVNLSLEMLSSLNNFLQHNDVFFSYHTKARTLPDSQQKRAYATPFLLHVATNVQVAAKASEVKKHGVLSAFLKGKALTDYVQNNQFGDRGFMILTDIVDTKQQRSTQIIAAPAFEQVKHFITEPQWQALYDSDVLSNPNHRQAYYVQKFRLVDDLQVVMLWPKHNQIMFLQQQTWHIFLLGMITFCMVVFLFSIFIKIEVLLPIKRLQKLTQASIEGTDVSDKKITQGELGKLSNSFIQMGKELFLTTNRLQNLAFYDELTGLSNRNLFLNNLSEQLAFAAKKQQKLGLFFIDLDGFKEVNDRLGHDAGDQLLKQVARRLNNSLEQYLIQQDLKNDNWVFRDVSRLGGDEFTILISDIDQQQTVIDIAKYVLANMEPPYFLEQYQFHITTSIGVAIYPDHGEMSTILLKNSDTAMYKAKELGKNRFQLYEPEMSALTLRRYEIKNALRCAIDNQELTLLYQPQLDVKSRKIVGCEALLRWHNPSLGSVGPDEFIPIAEESGLIIEIGEWVLQQAAKTAARLNTTQRFKIAVNVSAVQLRQSDVAGLVQTYLQKYQLDRDALEVEITESVMIDQGKKTQHSLLDLKQLGVHISMDDFGTGYSSLSQIQTLPLYCLKIDKSFISRCTQAEQGKNIVLAILALAQQLGLKTTAEGVETREELDLLATAGCSYIQGYFVSKPITELELVEFVLDGYQTPNQESTLAH